MVPPRISRTMLTYACMTMVSNRKGGDQTPPSSAETLLRFNQSESFRTLRVFLKPSDVPPLFQVCCYGQGRARVRRYALRLHGLRNTLTMPLYRRDRTPRIPYSKLQNSRRDTD